MKRILEAFLLVVAFVFLPTSLWLGSRSIAREIAAEADRVGQAQRGRQMAEELQREGSSVSLLEKAVGDFGEGAFIWLFGGEARPVPASELERTLSQAVPRYDLVVLARNSSGAWTPYYSVRRLDELPVQACVTIAAKIASDSVSSLSLALAYRDLSTALGSPMSELNLGSSNRRVLQQFVALDRTRGFLLESFPRTLGKMGAEARMVLISLFDLDEIRANHGVRGIVDRWDQPGIGVAFIAPDGRLVACDHAVSARADIRARLCQQVRERTPWSPDGEDMRGALAFGVPPMGRCNHHSVVVMFSGDGTGQGATSKYIVLSLLFVLSAAVIWRGLRVRPSVALALFGAFIVAIVLPLSGLDPVFRLAAHEHQQKRLVDEKLALHGELRALDVGLREDLRRLFNLTGRVASECRLGEELRRDDPAEGLPVLASYTARLQQEFAAVSGFNVLTVVVGRSRYSRTFNSAVSRNLEAGGRLFHPLMRRMLQWLNANDGGNDGGVDHESGWAAKIAIEFEVTRDVIVANTGADWFARLLYVPNCLSQLRVNLGRIYVRVIPFIVAGQWRYALTVLWDDQTVTRTYLRHRLSEAPYPATATRRIYAVNQTYLHRDSTPPGWQSDAVVVETVLRAERVGGAARKQIDVATGQILLEAVPAEHLFETILAGVRVLPDVNAMVRTVFFTLVCIVLLIAAALAASASAVFLRPLRRLLESLDQVRVGILDRPMTDVTRGDEFGVLAASFNQMLQGLRERELLGQYVSDSVRRAVRDDSFKSAAQKGSHRDMTILFAALGDFHSWCGGRPAREVATLLELHLAAVDEGVSRHGGEIDKVMGEKILVYFDHELLGGAKAAARAAMAVLQHVRASVRTHDPSVTVEAGINSGSVVAGILGAAQVRLAYTVIGDPVNLAARLAAVAHGASGSRVILSGAVYRELADELAAERLAVRQVKGKTQEVEAWQWCEPSTSTSRSG